MPIDSTLNNTNLVSQTQTFHNRKKSKENTSISGGNSINCDENATLDNNNNPTATSMHHSFINLIYPSKSKKLIANESHFVN